MERCFVEARCVVECSRCGSEMIVYAIQSISDGYTKTHCCAKCSFKKIVVHTYHVVGVEGDAKV